VLYQNKYRRNTLRLETWDYSNIGWYYITICTKDKKEYFGKVTNSKMILNKLGKVAEKEWLRIK